MSEASVMRLLDVVRQQLGADDARIEIGGQEPSDDRILWVWLKTNWRLVALFKEPPLDRQGQQEMLAQLARTFSGVAEAGTSSSMAAPARSALQYALNALRERVEGLSAVIIDASSPVLWASCHPFEERGEDLDAILRDAVSLRAAVDTAGGLDTLIAAGPEQTAKDLGDKGQALADLASYDEDSWRRYVLTVRAIAHVRTKLDPEGASTSQVRVLGRAAGLDVLARGFAGIYLLILTFDGPFDELKAESVLRRALPALQNMLNALPPVDPPPRGGKLIPISSKRV